ncbi:MAG: IS3 family transposase [Clostridia bacterium]|nr:IS3 family transposase [Clostridia bacterium]
MRKFRTREEARRAIFEYIEIFYNRKRRHQTLNYMTPASFLWEYNNCKAA